MSRPRVIVDVSAAHAGVRESIHVSLGAPFDTAVQDGLNPAEADALAAELHIASTFVQSQVPNKAIPT